MLNMAARANYNETEHNLDAPLTPELELMLSGLELGRIHADVQWMIDNPPYLLRAGDLRISEERIVFEEMAPPNPLGFFISSMMEGRWTPPREWNASVDAGLILTNSRRNPASGVLEFENVRIARRNEQFERWFRYGISARKQELEGDRTMGDIYRGAEIAGSVLTIVMSSPVRGAVVNGARVLRARFRALIARFGATMRRMALNRATRDVAQGLIARLRAQGRRIVVNIGGECSFNDIRRWGDAGQHAINLNLITEHRPGNVPNLVRADAADISTFFDARQVDEIISTRLPFDTLNWDRIIPGAGRVLRPGGRITINFQGVGEDAAVIVAKMEEVGFQNIENLSGAVITATR